MLAGPALLLAVSLFYYIHNAHRVTTDNAYVRQDKVSVSAEVGGRVVEVLVRENQHVKAGDLLFRIDPEPYKLAVADAEAAIANAQARLDTLETNYATSDVDIERSQKEVAYYQHEFDRQRALMKNHVTTKAALDAAEHNLTEARSRLATAHADAEKAKAALSTGRLTENVNPAVLAARVQKDKALLNLSRTEVRAPADGIISQSSRLQIGQVMVQGLVALSIVKDNVSWVEANFKETDLEDMHVGQTALIEVDTYADMKLKGHVESIGAGTGSEFSVLPAQNATGNWVKVTQRVPVRIAIDDKPSRTLIAGLSAYVLVDTSK
jgi:membrane fusion protein (multidrug efflux system)